MLKVSSLGCYCSSSLPHSSLDGWLFVLLRPAQHDEYYGQNDDNDQGDDNDKG